MMKAIGGVLVLLLPVMVCGAELTSAE